MSGYSKDFGQQLHLLCSNRFVHRTPWIISLIMVSHVHEFRNQLKLKHVQKLPDYLDTASVFDMIIIKDC